MSLQFCEKKADGFLLFLKAFSWETDLFSNARWFNGERRKIETGNLYLAENWFSGNEMWCSVVNHNHMRHIFATGILDLNFN